MPSYPLGPGVTRFLSAAAQQFTAVVWQADKPPLDSELNLMSFADQEALAQVVRSQVHSGFFLDPTRCEADYQTDALNANQFVLAPPAEVSGSPETAPVLYATVNGWVLPIAGSFMPESGGGDSAANRVRLFPPPTTDSRTDFVFLEVWQALVSANPSTVNKPSASELYKYGNTQYGGVNLADELEDPAAGFETTKRVQLQYRFRVVGSGDAGGVSVDLVNYPDGLTDPMVLGQGTAASPVGGMTFTNMREELLDPSLWRAGDGDPNNALGTVDGYVYAIPVCAVFRRNTSAFTALSSGGVPNQNGAAERTPSTHGLTDPQTGARLLAQATLFADLSETFTGYVKLNNYGDSGLDDPNLFPVGVDRRYLVIGEGLDREIVSINPNTDPGGLGLDSVYIEAGVGRGRGGTMAKAHLANTPVSLYNARPDGLYADQVAAVDILDMRRSVGFGDWDYNRLLQKGVAALVQNNLRTAFKLSGTGGDTVGVTTTEVSFFQQPTSATHLNAVAEVDGTDGIRTVWSDSAAVQGDVTVILDNNAALDASNYTSTTFDAAIGSSWTMGAGFMPNGFLNYTGTKGWCNGSVVFVDIGGKTGTEGARAGLLNGQQAVRFIAPYESWRPGDRELTSHHPWQLRFIGGPTGNSAAGSTPNSNAYRAGFMTTPNGEVSGSPDPNHPGPMFPMASTNFERPFIVLGGVLNPTLRYTGVVADASNLLPGTSTRAEVNIATIDWDTYPESSLLLGRDQKTLRDYLTNDGQDFTGMSSKLYLVIYGDPTSRDNNGAFQVIGAGTSSAQSNNPFTQNVATTATHLVVRPLSADYNAFTDTDNTVTIEFRSQEINAEDDNGSDNAPHGIAVVLTDLGADGLPWGMVSEPLETVGSPARLIPVASKATLTMDLLWSPSHGATPRVPDRISRFGVGNPPAVLYRSPVSVIDPVFAADTAYPEGDVLYPSTQVQLWNRLPSNGLGAPVAPSFGGTVVGNTEQDREAELFVDPGSKTVVFRPFTLKSAILKQFNETDPHPSPTLLGPSTYPASFPKDGNNLFTSGLTGAYAVPPEFMPRFGRQDIPYHTSSGVSDPLYPGINHLFADGPDATASVFYIIGGVDNTGPGNSVKSILFDTTIDYGMNGSVTTPSNVAYGARKMWDQHVVSSDLGIGLRGVELPPYLGIARLYGVYERADFVAHTDASNVGAFQNTNRTQPIVGVGGRPPVNLLRTDADKQTLFIRQEGANLYTGQEDSHTYVVPSDAIDITRIPGYVQGQQFADFDYVVECVVFGFAEGFINKNNYVLARRHSGTAALVLDSSAQELTNVSMVLPAPAPPSVSPYEVYSRTVYQGDPYMTRGGYSAQSADYATRYGQVPQASAFQLATAIDQGGVGTPNARAFEVLATMDFYTTLGTGKMGGAMSPNTILDCGYTTPNIGGTRIPSSAFDFPWRVLPRAFTEGQNDNPTHATAYLRVLDYSACQTNSLVVTVNGIPFTLGFSATTDAQYATEIAGKINENSSHVYASASGVEVTLVAREPGVIGNSHTVSLMFTNPIGANMLTSATVQTADSLPRTRVKFSGGVDIPVNGGNGDSIVSLTGMSERLPLGILVSDSDFLAENILGDGATSLRSYQGGLRAVYQNVPLTSNGAEFTRFLGEPGTELAMSDGSILQYVPYNPPTTPGGTKWYRLYRGGGATFVLSGVAPGGPVTWVGDSFSAAVQPVLKGAVLACKAILVRNYPEQAFGTVRSQGDEIQLLVLTQAVYGTPTTTEDGITLKGLISPTGYGEGYAAADRYRLPGLPMDRGRSRTTRDPTLPPAPYNGNS